MEWTQAVPLSNTPDKTIHSSKDFPYTGFLIPCLTTYDLAHTTLQTAKVILLRLWYYIMTLAKSFVHLVLTTK